MVTISINDSFKFFNYISIDFFNSFFYVNLVVGIVHEHIAFLILIIFKICLLHLILFLLSILVSIVINT